MFGTYTLLISYTLIYLPKYSAQTVCFKKDFDLILIIYNEMLITFLVNGFDTYYLRHFFLLMDDMIWKYQSF